MLEQAEREVNGIYPFILRCSPEQIDSILDPLMKIPQEGGRVKVEDVDDPNAWVSHVRDPEDREFAIELEAVLREAGYEERMARLVSINQANYIDNSSHESTEEDSEEDPEGDPEEVAEADNPEDRVLKMQQPSPQVINISSDSEPSWNSASWGYSPTPSPILNNEGAMMPSSEQVKYYSLTSPNVNRALSPEINEEKFDCEKSLGEMSLTGEESTNRNTTNDEVMGEEKEEITVPSVRRIRRGVEIREVPQEGTFCVERRNIPLMPSANMNQGRSGAHRSDGSKARISVKKKRGRSTFCVNCGQEGHIVSQCPFPIVNQFVNEAGPSTATKSSEASNSIDQAPGE